MAVIREGDENNNIRTGGENDDIRSGGGNDTIDSGFGDDVIQAEDGDDNVSAGPGNDFIQGDNGNDFIAGEANNDVLVGTTRTINVSNLGRGEVDRLLGGDGADIFLLGNFFDSEVSVELFVFYDDLDPNSRGRNDFALILDFDSSEGDSVELVGSPEDYVIGPSPLFGTSGDSIYLDTNGDQRFDNRDELIAILQGTRNLNLNSLDFRFIAGDIGDIEDNVFTPPSSGGDQDEPNDDNPNVPTEGNDDLVGTEDPDQIDGLGGDDRIQGLGSNDFLIGNEGDDSLLGGNGDDTLQSGTGSDSLDGGTGADILIPFDPTQGFGKGEIDVIISGTGADEIALTDPGRAEAIARSAYDDGDPSTAGLEDFALISGFNAEEDKVGLSGNADDYVIGDSPIAVEAIRDVNTAGDAIFLDTNRNAQLDSTDELIAVFSAVNNLNFNRGFRFSGGEFPELPEAPPDNADAPLLGTEEGDRLKGTDDGELIDGLGGRDRIFGLGGDDTLIGGEDKDRLDGGADNDFLDGLEANDVYIGGSGQDSFVISPGKGRDIIRDFERSQDTIIVRNDTLLDFEDLTFRQRRADVEISVGQETLARIKRADERDMSPQDFNFTTDSIQRGFQTLSVEIGSKGKDNLRGGRQAGILSGKSGNDRLAGRGGDDVLLGGKGRDTLIGGTGDDLLDGGKARDIYIGNGGADTFVLAARGGFDVIRDFQDGVDFLGVTHGLDPEAFGVSAQGQNAVVSLNNRRVAVLENVSADLISGEDFIAVEVPSI